MTEQEEQARREAVAAVEVHERQVVAAQARVEGGIRKAAKFDQHVAAVREEIESAREALGCEQADLERVRRRAAEVLAEGPVSLNGAEVRALAEVADVATQAGSGGNG